MTRSLKVAVETWPIAGNFTISRGAKTEAVVVAATIADGSLVGRGEAVPYGRYGETVEGVVATISGMAAAIATGLDRTELRRAMAAGAARNALDCALWDLEAKETGRSVADIVGLASLHPVETAFTLSLDTPEAMARGARAVIDWPLLKVKLGGAGDPERLAAVRRAAPHARLIVDANESWSAATYAENMAASAAVGAELVEQPFPAGDDSLLDRPRAVPVCADESLHVAEDVCRLSGRYDAVNIKLDKAGGLTEALDLAEAARKAGMKIMVGCMVGTSLAMAPAMLLAQCADWVDLDGPLLLARDRLPGLCYEGSLVFPPEPALWG